MPLKTGRITVTVHAAGVLVMLALLPTAATGAGLRVNAEDAADEFIRVADDGWHFETSGTHTRFVPFGGIYYDPETYTDKPFPRFLIISGFNEERTDRHFSQIAALGANVIRISLSTGIFSPQYGETDESAFKTLDKLISLAHKHGLRVVLDLSVEWEGRAQWAAPRWESFTDEKTIKGLELLYAKFAERYKDNPTVFSYLVLDEPRLPWSSGGLRREWGNWVRRKYETQEKLKLAWDDYPADSETWDAVLPPEDRNSPGSRRLYDYQLFRQDTAAEFIRRLAGAIRSRDRNHLVSMGNLQWAAPLRVESLTENILRPSGYPGFDPRKTGGFLDYTHINCYDWWDSHTAEFARALGRYAYCPGKPVILGEFSFDSKVVEYSRQSYAGYMVWAFYPLPSEPSHHYLFDAEGNPTEHAKAFEATAAKLRSGDLVLDRSEDGAMLTVDAIAALTDVPSTAAIYGKYVQMSSGGKVVGLEMEEIESGGKADQ